MEDLKTFISIHNTDMLISETHFTGKTYLKPPNYTLHHKNHSAGTTIIIKNSIKLHQPNNYSQESLQATSVPVKDSVGLLTISAVYLPHRYTVKQGQLEEFYNTLDHRFIMGGDYSAKHTNWGSRLNTPKGCKLLSAMENLKHLSMVEPTHWPSDRNKLLDLVNFSVKKVLYDAVNHNKVSIH
jgi:hypothetical protein